MIRRHLIEMMAIATIMVAISWCASADSPQPAAGPGQATPNELGASRTAWAECVQAQIPRLDDLQSPSVDVATAAMKSCTAQYAQMQKAMASAVAVSCGQNQDCTRDAMAKAQREATRNAIDYVVSARIRVAGAQVLKCQ